MTMSRKYNYCNTCKDWHWDDAKCYDVYLVFHDEYAGDESHEIRSGSFDSAAIKYAEWYNTHDSDYHLMNNQVEIEIEFHGKRKKYSISAEPDIHYSADEIMDNKNES